MVSAVYLIKANSENGWNCKIRKKKKAEILFVFIDSGSLMNLFVIPYIFVK